MKKVFLVFLALALLLAAGTAALARVDGTKHDVRVIQGADPNSSELEPCAMCHTPHKGTGLYPLWNRTQTVPTYTLYDSPSFDMQVTIAQPQAPSTHCLTCHNGVISSLVNYPGPNELGAGDEVSELYTYQMDDVFQNLGDIMTDDHPISFTYNPALDDVTDNNGFPAITTDAASGRQYIAGSGDAAGIKYFLYDNNGTKPSQMECSTCHAVHDTYDYDGKDTFQQVRFLRGTNAGSAMCMSCHTNR